MSEVARSNADADGAAKFRRGVAMEIDPGLCDIFDGNGRAKTPFDPTANAALIKDIQRNGQQTPAVARKRGDRYEIVAGTRRLGSLLELKKSDPSRTLKVIVFELDDTAAWNLADKENANRRDLTPLQRARAWSYAIETLHGGRQDKFAESVGENRSVVSRTLSLLKIPDEVLQALRNSERVSVHFAELLVPALQDKERAKTIRKIARNLAETRGPMSGPELLDALLSTPAENAQRATVTLNLEDIDNHSSFKRKRDGTATLSMKAIDPAAHDPRSRRALLNEIVLHLRKFFQLDGASSGNSHPEDAEAKQAGVRETVPGQQ